MSKHNTCGMIVAALLLTAASSGAWAEDDYSDKPRAANWPLAFTERPLTLSRGMIEIAGDTLWINLSSDSVGEPISLAPDIWYGLNDNITVGITHQIGICLNSGCGYNDTALEGRLHLLQLGRGELAASFGVHVPSLSDPFIMGAGLGLISRFNIGSVALRIDPRLYAGIAGRDYRKEVVEVPVQIQYLLNPNTTVYLATGLTNGTLDGFGDNAQVPVGLGAILTLGSRFDVGGEFRFENLVGPAGNKGSVRVLTIRAALRI